MNTDRQPEPSEDEGISLEQMNRASLGGTAQASPPTEGAAGGSTPDQPPTDAGSQSGSGPADPTPEAELVASSAETGTEEKAESAET